MATKKKNPSALKAARSSRRKQLRHRAVHGSIHTVVTKARASIEADPAQAEQAVKAAIAKLDVAARKGTIHANTAARKKSRLMKRLHKAQGVTPKAEAATAKKRRATPRKRTTAAKAKV